MSKLYKKGCILSLLMLISISTLFAQQSVTGRVTDTNGALAGVTVVVPGTNRSTQTDAQGSFSIQAARGEKLRFSTVGYVAQEVEVTGQTVNVTLQEDAGALDEVVVTALGRSVEQRKLGYAISTVKGEDIVKSSPTNFASALYGKATGVSINTNAGGGNSAVSIDIRGNMNSISFQRQPLIVVDGVITRNEEVNNQSFWDDQRIRGNGILDINPENIESINILKGAAASALYGSDAAAGVVVITTKSGKGSQGFGVDFSLSQGIEQVAMLPDYQYDFGPGYARSVGGVQNDGFIHRTVSNGRIWFGTPNQSSTLNIAAPSQYNEGDIVLQPRFSAWGQFGPRFNGQEAIFWDGQIRNYVAYKDNYKKFYQDGRSGIYNVAIYNANEKSNYRLSYTRNSYQGVMESGPQNKNTFNLNSTYHITPKLDVSVIANYVNEHINNRPYMIDRMTNNYTGFLSAVNNIDWFEKYYKTSQGYKYVTAADRAQNPEEAFLLSVGGGDYMDYLWTQRERQYDEYNNRLMATGKINYKILDNLSIRGTLGTDFTSFHSQNKEPNTIPLHIGTSGHYSVENNRYNILYGDILLSYNLKVSEKTALNFQAGYQGREETYNYSSANTEGGLSQRNWFSMNASNSATRGYARRRNLVKDGLFGVAGLEFNNYLFIEGSIRQERTSTLATGNNVFYYPSISSALELSNLFKMPTFVSYSKLRASFGVVGNPPDPYTANVVYDARSVSGTPTLVLPNTYGNDNLQNETKREFEVGLENTFLNNRLGLDLTYYNNQIVDMIVPLDVAFSTGTSKIMQNVGNMRNYGLEIGLNFTPVKNENFSWDSRINFAFNRNKLTKLAENLEMLEHSNVDNGSLYVRSEVGKAAGDIFTYDLKRNADGDLLVDGRGFYIPDYDNLIVAGNIQPKTVGGFINGFQYKSFLINTVIDFRFGGQVYSPSIQYGRSAGMYKETLFGRDEQTGGIPYYVGTDGRFVDARNGAPSGATIFHDGIVLDGKNADGTANTSVIEAGEYYRLSNYWGSYPGAARTGTYKSAVFDNDFIRMREISLAYTLPAPFANRIKAKNVVVSAYGRNLFFIHKTIPHLDPEATRGTNWISRANIGNAGVVPRSFGLSLRASF
ncbi:SusC/RagA family TonB-linked outer membrane protein [Sphingobacterium paludis]|uniref:TonB-linked SusC/RagA family outer membrane protein n=1 Tax=Sphingobacterium paludis TaxID=1476465 RepID=A0A4R7D4I4_9SPHI|nr:SusC/RagA family TonB-linked outer membrane protein [Sphingobacterium paludis]TDS15780.1 TonB-linked SusC/RagA family outer membrane protein [Sphingobacterium paludis]